MASDRTGIAILAGGHGSRLWPLSRPDRPKQFVPLLPEGSMLQATFARALQVVPASNIIVVGNREHRELYEVQLPAMAADNLILEPTGLGTMPCIALTALREASLDRFDVVVTVPADHVVADPGPWIAAVQTAARYAAKHDELVSIASIPDTAETKFGYLVTRDRRGGTDENPVLEVARFVEKPELGQLEALLESGDCLRNMGMIAFRPELMLQEVERFAPAVAGSLRKAGAAGFDEASLDEAYAQIPKASIDESILQKTGRLAAVASRIRSIDAGDFASLGDALDKDGDGNAVEGRTVIVAAKSNTIVTDDALVAAVGVDELIIVVDGDTVLVCPKDQSQRIREAADR